MKGAREHRAPLSNAALAVLREAARLRHDDATGFVSPGMKAGTGLSNMAMLVLLRRMGRGEILPHRVV
jgi:hypothetical protein